MCHGSVVLPTLSTSSSRSFAPASESSASHCHGLRCARCAVIARQAYRVNVTRTLWQTLPCTPRARVRAMSTLSQEDLQAYAKRVQHSLTQLKPTLQTLQNLQFAHIRHIPFENLSLHHPKAVARQEGISTELEKVFHKLVLQPRGGYCFEQNTLFLAVLKTLGFTVYPVAARVVTHTEEDSKVNHMTGTEHMCLIVSFDDGTKWLTDVGFGGQVARRPVRLDQLDMDPPRDSSTYGYRHRIRPGQLGSTETAEQKELSVHAETAGYYLQCTTSKGGWKDLHFFSLQQCTEKDFAMYNWFCATCPDAPMMNMQVAAIQTEHGRVTYNGKDVKVVETTEQVIDKPMECVKIESQRELDQQLMLKFGIRVD